MLNIGSRGNEVTELQNRLIELGYLKGDADGVFGHKTKGAVIMFQKDYNLIADGIVGPKTFDALEDSLPIIKFGDTGDYVIQLQSTLLEMGYLKGAVDGYFGEKTLNAVINFQRDNDLSKDGIVGMNTWAKLKSGYPILQLGSTNGFVSILQTKLSDLGYRSGSIDGRFGNMTHYAVTAFQNNNGLTGDGIVGKRTWAKLNSDNPVASADDWIEYGDTGTKVEQIQNKLDDLGYDIGTDNGTFGTATKDAVKSFQTDNGLQVDGIVGPDTWEALFDSYPVLKQGSTGTYVSQVQTILNSLGYDCGTVDGIFGSGTKGKVEEFQRNNGVTADGIVGAKTWSALTSPNPVKATSSILLQKGSRGEDVRRMQNRLIELGYSCGRAGADGIFGRATYNAVITFQEVNNLTVDGIVGSGTLTLLLSTIAIAHHHLEEGELLCKGVSGTLVTTLQQKLIALGYSCGNQGADGYYGPATYNAVLEFQRNNNCTTDGVVGPETWDALDSPDAVGPSPEDPPITDIRFGSRGENVKIIQKRLIELGYSCGSCGADGIFGSATQNAVTQFQRNNDLTANGIVDQDTMDALKSNKAKGPADSYDYHYGDVCEYAEKVITDRECGSNIRFGAVNLSDHGSLSIGFLQWHGTRAYDLLVLIKDANPTKAEEILTGTSIYSELMQANNSLFCGRELTELEGEKISELLETEEGKAAQYAQRKTDVEGYITKGEALGITDKKALIFFADAYNKSPAAAKRMVNAAGGGSGLTLDSLYHESIEDDIKNIGHEIERRTKTYNDAKKFGELEECIDRMIEIAMQEYSAGERESYGESDPNPEYAKHSKYWTKYGQWYGDKAGKTSYYRASWCNMFVSWCANKAGIMGKLIPCYAYTENSRKWFDKRSAFKHKDTGYIPKKGDCIFYLFDNPDRTVNHIGFVREDSDGVYVKTVEGNTSTDPITNISIVNTKKRTINYSNIVAYGDIRAVALWNENNPS